MKGSQPDETRTPPFDTEDLRRNLAKFLDADFPDPVTGNNRKLGNFKWGVYAFFDYDGEPIYVGQTNEMLRVRIRRHLTNQRTDAVAMSVLDPFEVLEIEAWPLPQFQEVAGKNMEAQRHLNALESQVTANAVAASKFAALLNEKDAPAAAMQVDMPPSFRGRIVSDEVFKLRSHPDFRTARRALITARLAQVISEREVKGGLRRTLVTQTKRLNWLAERRYMALGGSGSVEKASEGEDV